MFVNTSIIGKEISLLFILLIRLSLLCSVPGRPSASLYCVSPVRAVPFKTFLERTVTFLLAELLLVSRYIQKLDQVEQK